MTMWNKKISALRQNVEIINNLTNYNVIPSESIYYGLYPYRVKLLPNFLGFNSDMPFYKRTMYTYDFLRMNIAINLQSYQMRFRGSYSRRTDEYTMYIAHYEFVKYLISILGDKVTEISGPVSEEHLDILYDPSKYLTVREGGWYGKWDTGYSFWFPWSPTYHRKKDQQFAELREFITQTFNEDEYQFSPTTWLTKIFGNSETIKDIIPWVKINYPDVKIREHVCMIIDK